MLLILGVALLIVIVVIFVVIKTMAVKNANDPNASPSITETPIPTPVYEAQLGDIKFIVMSAQDLGSVLKNPRSSDYDITTTEKFIKVIIGAQNKAKVNTTRGAWEIGNIVDAEGRNFISINDQAYDFVPRPNPCGESLKPEFEPVACVKLYEVSKASTNLKVMISFIPQGGEREDAFLDLIVR